MENPLETFPTPENPLESPRESIPLPENVPTSPIETREKVVKSPVDNMETIPPLEDVVVLDNSFSELEIRTPSSHKSRKIEFLSTLDPHNALPPLITEDSEEESSEEIKKRLAPVLSAHASEEDEKICIVDRSNQLDKFIQLLRGSERGRPHSSCFEMGKFNILCDQYNTGFPSDSARISLSDNTQTNGAYVWEKLILIQGPHCEVQIEHLWRILAEKRAGAIIRLGPLKGYKFYCPKENPLCYEGLTIESVHEFPKLLFYSTTCTNYSLDFKGEKRSFPVYAVKGWRDFKTNQVKEIYELCVELDKIEGPLIVHCKGGFGRTGTFAVCWKIFQLFKAAQKNRLGPLVIDPAALVDEMRLIPYQHRSN